MSGPKISKFGRPQVEAVARFLRAEHPNKTAECVGTLIGVPASTVRKWLDGSSAPGFAATVSMICVYGPRFIAAAIETRPAWVDDATRADLMADIEARRARMMEELRSLSDR